MLERIIDRWNVYWNYPDDITGFERDLVVFGLISSLIFVMGPFSYLGWEYGKRPPKPPTVITPIIAHDVDGDDDREIIGIVEYATEWTKGPALSKGNKLPDYWNIDQFVGVYHPNTEESLDDLMSKSFFDVSLSRVKRIAGDKHNFSGVEQMKEIPSIDVLDYVDITKLDPEIPLFAVGDFDGNGRGDLLSVLGFHVISYDNDAYFEGIDRQGRPVRMVEACGKKPEYHAYVFYDVFDLKD